MATGCSRGCATLVVASLLATGVAYAGFRYGDEVFPTLERWVGRETPEADPEPSPALAEATLQRVEAFRSGASGEARLLLDGPALSSVVRYSLPGILPEGVRNPTVDFRGDELLLSARVAVASFPDATALGEALGFLPDTVEVEMRGALRPFGPKLSALYVQRVEASRIPLPGRLVPGILTALGRHDRDGLPDDALAIALPEGIGSAFVEADHLVLISDEG